MTVSTIYSSCPLYVPSAVNSVALRPSSVWIKSQIGVGSLQTMVKYLHRLIFSMAVSMTMVFVNKPHRENRPVVISNTKQAETAISRSTASKAVPIFIEVYFFRIMATMSVPPLEAPMLNMIAELMPGMAMAKISSRTGWSVSGPDMGNSFSAADSATDIRTLIYTVFTPKPFPRNRNPSTSSAMLMIKLYVPADSGETALSTTARPVTPPKEKLFGNLKR